MNLQVRTERNEQAARVFSEELLRWVEPIAQANGISVTVKEGVSQVGAIVCHYAFINMTG